MVLAVEGLAVAHVTLHMALRDVFGHLTTAAVLEKARLLDGLLRRLLGRQAAAGRGGAEPARQRRRPVRRRRRAASLRRPSAQAKAEGLDVSGPWPTDTLFVRARDGEFDGVVAMYHDQGHIALKLLGAAGRSTSAPACRSCGPAWPTARPTTSPAAASPTPAAWSKRRGWRRCWRGGGASGRREPAGVALSLRRRRPPRSRRRSTGAAA